MASRAGNRRRVSGWIKCGALCLTVLGIGLPARAAGNCPWINVTTASGLLGAPAKAVYTGTSPFQPGTCTFVANMEGGARTLTINVEVAHDAQARDQSLRSQCSAAPRRIDAIGNEAWLCEVNGKHGSRSDLVVGRVRDQVFSILIGSEMKDDRDFGQEALGSLAYTAAEQVSGNLF